MKNKDSNVSDLEIACRGQTICDKRHIRDLDILKLIGHALIIGVDQPQMLRDVLKILEQRRGMLHCAIMLLTPDGKELVLEAENTGSGDEGARYRRGEGITGAVLESGEMIVVPLVSNEPRFKGRVHVRGEGEQFSFICVPIRLENRVIGTLSADHAVQDDSMLQESARLLEIVASLVAGDAGKRRAARVDLELLEAENKRLRSRLEDNFRPQNMIGESNEIKDVFQRVQQVAPSDTTVLIRGESGTGKELIAAAIHYNSRRRDKPFIKINCAALSESLLESELFGHEKGAFTGALYKRVGRLEEADGGTLFLDELGDFSPAIQVKLLRVIQEREYERVGSNQTLKADVRIISATNRDLEAAVAEGRFREDLYYRINVFSILLPPLRERRSDILLLANYFVALYGDKIGHKITRISTPAINMLMAYHWPGNVREFENCIEHAVLMCSEGVIFGHHFPPTLQMPGHEEVSMKGSLKGAIELLEREMVTNALKRHRGSIASVSRELGITGRMVRYKIEKLGINRDKFKKRK